MTHQMKLEKAATSTTGAGRSMWTTLSMTRETRSFGMRSSGARKISSSRVSAGRSVGTLAIFTGDLSPKCGQLRTKCYPHRANRRGRHEEIRSKEKARRLGYV